MAVGRGSRCSSAGRVDLAATGGKLLEQDYLVNVVACQTVRGDEHDTVYFTRTRGITEASRPGLVRLAPLKPSSRGRDQYYTADDFTVGFQEALVLKQYQYAPYHDPSRS